MLVSSWLRNRKEILLQRGLNLVCALVGPIKISRDHRSTALSRDRGSLTYSSVGSVSFYFLVCTESRSPDVFLFASQHPRIVCLYFSLPFIVPVDAVSPCFAGQHRCSRGRKHAFSFVSCPCICNSARAHLVKRPSPQPFVMLHVRVSSC